MHKVVAATSINWLFFTLFGIAKLLILSYSFLSHLSGDYTNFWTNPKN